MRVSPDIGRLGGRGKCDYVGEWQYGVSGRDKDPPGPAGHGFEKGP